MSLHTRRELLIHELQRLYGAELQLLIALPIMLGAATALPLAAALREHLGPKLSHVLRLEECLALLEVETKAVPCVEMDRLMHEVTAIAQLAGQPSVRDRKLVSVAQRIEQYEIAAYRTSVALAGALGEESIAMLLRLTLDEERAADSRLSAAATIAPEASTPARTAAETPHDAAPAPASPIHTSSPTYTT